VSWRCRARAPVSAPSRISVPVGRWNLGDGFSKAEKWDVLAGRHRGAERRTDRHQRRALDRTLQAAGPMGAPSSSSRFSPVRISPTCKPTPTEPAVLCGLRHDRRRAPRRGRACRSSPWVPRHRTRSIHHSHRARAAAGSRRRGGDLRRARNAVSGRSPRAIGALGATPSTGTAPMSAAPDGFRRLLCKAALR
jgi:hypothetical protein